VPHPTDLGPIDLAEQTWQFAGGSYVERNGSTYLEGAMYVERYVPSKITRRFPVVLFHGGVQTGTNFTATPDGRRGWLHDFLRAGYAVYIVDQPERGRSGHALSETQAQTARMQRYSVEQVQERFAAPASYALWPQAHAHTQWPGTGLKGDPAFDRFYASQVEMLGDRGEIERVTRDAGVALLDEIGPAILLTHSQSGPFGWLIADRRPELVKGIIAIEPNGPPFKDVMFSGGSDWYQYVDELARPYGITRLPLRFEPPLEAQESLTSARQTSDLGGRLVSGHLQAEPARTLQNLAGLNILIATAQASYHAPYDHCTSEFLNQAGVGHDFVYLEEHGLAGNAHMVMLEKNNHEIADFLLEWLQSKSV
jgi:pimeloyl-ACP methyl ester carboxylesterase